MTRTVAILGAGIGEKHLAGYLALGDRFRVSHVCDLDVGLAEKLAATAGAKAVTDLAEIIADPAVEIVDICLPPMLHVPVALDALAAGKHVIIEKPVAGSLADADRLAAAEANAAGRVFPVFQYRYGRSLETLSRLEAAGLLGQPQTASLETHWNRGADYYAVAWRGTWARELGGAVLSHAIHSHDLLARAFGPVKSVSAMLTTRINPIETEDCAAIAFAMQNGALATSSITLGAADDTSRLRLVYEHVTVESGRLPYAPGEDQWTFTARNPDRQTDIDAVANVAPAKREGFAGYLEAVADALDGKASDAVTLANGVASIELVTAIYHAHRTGQRVSLPIDRSLPICAGLKP
ncbi:Gfo/Idh/MocA family protein [Oricola sp.]|uniref:Gfo/Idh/MocA family protein n=1 Tax=Oricola sp. TaxID=1979950 RepID=UPI003BAC211F